MGCAAAASEPNPQLTRFESARGYIEFVECFPLFAASFVGVQDLDVLAEFLEYSTDRFFSRKKTIAYIVDVTQILEFGSLHRKLQADWIRRNRTLIEAHAAGVCFALSSQVQRGLLTAIFWISKPGYPHNFVSSRKEAVAWSVAQLRDASVVVPPDCIDQITVAPYHRAS